MMLSDRSDRNGGEDHKERKKERESKQEMEKGGVEGVIIDACLLFSKNANGQLHIPPNAVRLLCRLCYSKLHIGILFVTSTEKYSPEKESLIRAVTTWSSLLLQKSDDTQIGLILKAMVTTWTVPSEHCVFLSSQLEEIVNTQVSSEGLILCQISEFAGRDKLEKGLIIKNLDEFPSRIARLYKVFSKEVISVGYIMKWSREIGFLKRGALPFRPTNNGLSFFSIDLESSLDDQLASADAVLHKPTDEVVGIDHMEMKGFADGIRFSDGFQRLKGFLEQHESICIIDPLERVLPLLDRASIQAVLRNLGEIVLTNHGRIRSPRFLKVDCFGDPGMYEALEAANVTLPTIVKPQIACGASESHTMAVVFRKEGYEGLKVPTPATVQEYIDHGSTQYKFYVVGEKVFHSIRRSTPDAAELAESIGGLTDGPPLILFDSLRSLPIGTPGGTNVVPAKLDVELVQAAAMGLRKDLGLTVFGFDVVVQLITQDHVIVDVNYFPSFNDIPDNEAIPAFWEAIRHSFELHQ